MTSLTDSPSKMKIQDIIKTTPWARERKNKNTAIAFVLKQNFPALQDIPGKTIANMVGDILTADRGWRDFLLYNKEYRGTDYGDKDMLEQEAQIALGYSGGETVSEFRKIVKGQ